MTKAKSDSTKNTTGFVLGRQAFAAMSAVEGLKLNPSSEKRLKDLASSSLTAAERRQAVVQAYSTPKARG